MSEHEHSPAPLYPGQRPHYVDTPRLPAGLRIKYDFAGDGTGYQFGFTITESGSKWEAYPQGPWSLPNYATPVRFDGHTAETWVRSCCLELITGQIPDKVLPPAPQQFTLSL